VQGQGQGSQGGYQRRGKGRSGQVGRYADGGVGVDGGTGASTGTGAGTSIGTGTSTGTAEKTAGGKTKPPIGVKTKTGVDTIEKEENRTPAYKSLPESTDGRKTRGNQPDGVSKTKTKEPGPEIKKPGERAPTRAGRQIEHGYKSQGGKSKYGQFKPKAEETIDDITRDILRIEKEIDLEIKEIQSLKLVL
jgi:hypothetical protein